MIGMDGVFAFMVQVAPSQTAAVAAARNVRRFMPVFRHPRRRASFPYPRGRARLSHTDFGFQPLHHGWGAPGHSSRLCNTYVTMKNRIMHMGVRGMRLFCLS
jgi:hypothetical protein